MADAAVEPDDGSSRTTTTRWVPWLVGVVLGLLVVGPALGPGALLNLDLVVLPHQDFPEGFWGLGTEVPRPLPFGAVMVAVGAVVGHVFAAKVVMVATVALAFVGMYRLLRPVDPMGAWFAAFLYGGSPFLITRIVVGHGTFAAAMAVLPWVLPNLCTPERSWRRTFLSSGALALCGFFGGMISGGLVAAALVLRRPRRWWWVVVVWVVAQIPWLAPGLAVVLRGPDLGGSSRFPSDTDSAADGIRLLAGHGFWQDIFQVGAPGGVPVLVAGLVLLGLSVAGHRHLPVQWRGPTGLAAAVSLAIVLVELLPGGDWVIDRLTSIGPGAVLRETQRMLALYIVWMAPASVLGARALAERATNAAATALRWTPAGVAIVLLAPGLWGAGQLERFDTPPGWLEAREVIAAEPGPVLVLPWNRYLDVDAANGRLSYNPMADFLPGDVIISPDLGLDTVGNERVDPRDPAIESLLPSLRTAGPTADALAAAGVRWVVILHEARYQPYLNMLEDPGLTSRVVDRSIDLVEVDPWVGPARTALGVAVDIGGPPLWPRVDADEELIWAAPAAAGWLRGWQAAGRTPAGLVVLPAGSGPVWFWPGMLLLASYALWLGLTLRALFPTERKPPGQRLTGRVAGMVTRE